MSAKGNRSDYIILGVVLTGAAIVLALAAGAGWFEEKADEAPPIRTTYSSNPEGTKAFWMLMDRLDMPLTRLQQSFKGRTLASVDVLFILDPMEDLGGEERSALEAWIAGGGVLVYHGVFGLAGGFETTGDSFGYPAGMPRHYGDDALSTKPVPPSLADLPLARDVERIVFADSDTLYVPDGTEVKRRETDTDLFADSSGLRIATRQVGEGRTIALADTSFLSNRLLGQGDNCVLAANVVAYALDEARGGRVAYDEYHMGFGDHATSWSTLWAALFQNSAGWAVLTAAGAGACYLIYKGRRFGTRRAPQRTRRRSKLEYVHSVGATYRAAGAHGLAFRILFGWFRSRCAELTGLPETAGSSLIAAHLARRTGKPQAGYENAFEAYEKALAMQKLSDRRLTALLQHMANMEREIFDGTQRRK
jgi:hypothetical protein